MVIKVLNILAFAAVWWLVNFTPSPVFAGCSGDPGGCITYDCTSKRGCRFGSSGVSTCQGSPLSCNNMNNPGTCKAQGCTWSDATPGSSSPPDAGQCVGTPANKYCKVPIDACAGTGTTAGCFVSCGSIASNGSCITYGCVPINGPSTGVLCSDFSKEDCGFKATQQGCQWSSSAPSMSTYYDPEELQGNCLGVTTYSCEDVKAPLCSAMGCRSSASSPNSLCAAYLGRTDCGSLGDYGYASCHPRKNDGSGRGCYWNYTLPYTPAALPPSVGPAASASRAGVVVNVILLLSLSSMSLVYGGF